MPLPSSSWTPSAAKSAMLSFSRIMRALACSRGSLRDKLVERLRQPLEVMQLARRHRRRLLAEAVDPDDGHAEGDRRSDVVEEARGDVNLPTRVGVAAL